MGTLPRQKTMYRALVNRDTQFDGVFFVGVRTTGIFCRPICTAKKPKEQNCEFFRRASDALYSGYRACKRCRPLEPRGSAPEWLRPLIKDVDAEPERRWTDADLRSRGLSPERVRRWFKSEHGMTFHAYARARRLGRALTQIRKGSTVTHTAFDSGYESLSGFNDAVLNLLGKSPQAASQRQVAQVRRITTPLGPMIAAATEESLWLLEFADRRMIEKQIRRVSHYLKGPLVPGTNTVLDQIEGELQEYFDGRRTTFQTPIHAPGSEFQMQVWKQLQRVPSGTTRSYQDLARSISRPTAVRAVARANGDNRIAILIPCHRIIGKNGNLTGYGGGLWRKKKLLEIEHGLPE